MRTTLHNNIRISISKELMAALPAAKYTGGATIIDNEENLARALNVLEACELVGFDTETRPSFRRGVSHVVSLMQLASDAGCFLLRLHKIGMPQRLVDFLENPTIPKVGLSLKDDFHQLNKLTSINPAGFIDLQKYVKQFGIEDNSLSKIHSIIFGERISKNQRLTNWEAATLTPAQINYAAYDAVACMRIYRALTGGDFDGKASPYIIEEGK